MQDFDETPDIRAFLETDPGHDARGLEPDEVREILQEAFDAARLNRIKRAKPSGYEDLEPHAKVLQKADALQKIVEGGRMAYESWCVEQGMHPGEAAKLYLDTMAYLRELTDASAEEHIATARARYDDLYRRLHRRGEFKEAAQVQAKLDKLNQLGGTEDGDLLGSMRRTIERLGRPVPTPTRPEPG